jgi:hypothetical protein
MAYYKIDVMGKNGYSFMVETDEELRYDEDAIDLAVEHHLFQDSEDADYAVVDDLVTERDIEKFKSSGCCHKI